MIRPGCVRLSVCVSVVCIATWHPTQVNASDLDPAKQAAGTRFTYPGKTEG